MFIGAHVSTAGGASKAIARAEEIGAECMQIFASSPRAWSAAPIPAAEAEKFCAETARAKMGPTVIHGKYLCALGAPDPELVEKSVTALTSDLQASEQLGALGVIFHPASHRGQGLDAVFDQFVGGVKRILRGAPGKSLLMLEISAGSGDHIGSKLADLGRIVKAVNDPRVAICLDTQHSWAAGYDVVSRPGLDKMLDEFEREIGLGLLRAVHANDSKKALGSAVDRHDNIGDGLIGRAGFVNIMSNTSLLNLTLFLYVEVFSYSV
jgi:deoxyribonuclease-4